jgi:hypothetical protein
MPDFDDNIERPDPKRGKGAPPGATRRVTLDRTSSAFTTDELLWAVIRDRTQAIAFKNYSDYIDSVVIASQLFRGVDGYQALKIATRAWLQTEAGVWLEDTTKLPDIVEADPAIAAVRAQEAATETPAEQTARKDMQKTVEQMRKEYLAKLDGDLQVLPYHEIVIERLRDAVPLKQPDVIFGDYGISSAELFRPVMLELIWSYWHEEGMLVQSINAITRRFQNRRIAGGGRDPLERIEIDPLRTVSNLLWGYLQDEWNLLTVQRRAYEYQHEYGISLLGKAIPEFEPADTRSRFLTAFHDLLLICSTFYDADDDTTVIADAFPVLNALKDVHSILAEGAHNQFGDLPWTARSEMLIQQWILARPEMREFLGGRPMVPYREPWMDRVDTMKQIQGWGDVSVTHFRDLAVFGERLLLSIRYGSWSTVDDPLQAENWARFWRPEVKTYIHSYRSVTGVDLTGQAQQVMDVSRDGRYLQPAVHLRNRLTQRRRRPELGPAPGPSAAAQNGAGAGAAARRALTRGD